MNLFSCCTAPASFEPATQWRRSIAAADGSNPADRHIARPNLFNLTICGGINRFPGHGRRSTCSWICKYSIIWPWTTPQSNSDANTRRFQLLKTIGWRVLVGFGALYGCVYFYERVSWTNSAKEKTFKNQYVQHATRKLKLIVDLTSANCSHQVQQ